VRCNTIKKILDGGSLTEVDFCCSYSGIQEPVHRTTV